MHPFVCSPDSVRSSSLTPSYCAVIALVLAIALGGLGCDEGSTGGSIGNGLIDVSGGSASGEDGYGGQAGPIFLDVQLAVGNVIEVFQTGEADASFVPFTDAFVEAGDPEPDYLNPDFGSNNVLIVSGVVVQLDPADLDLLSPGALYALSDDVNLYSARSDESDVIVTGVDVLPTGTLILPASLSGNAFFEFTHAVRNDGEIRGVETLADDAVGLWLETASIYVGEGRISTHGTWAGQNGGPVEIRAGHSLFNAGEVLAYGADSAMGDGGDSGPISLNVVDTDALGRLENLGDLRAYGGDATGLEGAGGGSMGIRLSGIAGVFNSGDLDASGGDATGNAPGGWSRGIGLFALLGAVINDAGSLDAYGGDSETGTAGNGGSITFGAITGELRSTGDVDVAGGDAFGEDGLGGGGGSISFAASSFVSTPASDIELSGRLSAVGGEGDAQGGYGGSLSVHVANRIPVSQESIRIYGISNIDARGGAGGQQGGHGSGDTEVLSPPSRISAGGITLEPAIDASGGDADAEAKRNQTRGGAGGVFQLDAFEIMSSGIDVSGGAGDLPGLAGQVEVPEALAVCGNAALEIFEQCDDGNLTPEDGCSPVCRLEVCGDGLVQDPLGESCDDGNTVSGDGCSDECQFEF